MGVTLVSNIPLPANPVPTQNVLATESKGLSKSKPQPVVEEKEAVPIPEKNAKIKPKPVQQPTPSQRKPPPQPVEEANNIVPFGEGGSGRPTHVQIEQSSGVPSLDQSAVRALQRIDSFGPLPSDYSGSKVSVEFWFDYKR